MKIGEIRETTENMKTMIRAIEKAARIGDTKTLEESAKRLESQAGSLVAAMQVEGITL